MQAYLDRILASLTLLNRPVVKFLRKGVERRSVAETLRGSGLAAPSEIMDLWHWRDGTAIAPGRTKLDDVHFFPGFYFYSLRDATKQYHAMRNDPRWNSNWFPIFANGGGDFYAVDLTKENLTHAPIIGFVLGEPSHPVEYESLENMCVTLALCYERGIIYTTPDGYLEMDDAAHATLARKLNPTVELWKDD